MKLTFKKFAVFLVIFSFLLIPNVKGQKSSYFLGDAVVYKGQIIIGSLNMGNGLELIKQENNKLSRAGSIQHFKAAFSLADDFYSFTFSNEGDKLYAYLVDGRYLAKYDVSNPASPALVSEIRDNSWDYFMGVQKRGDNIITFGVQGVKVWNLAGQIIDTYNLTNRFTYNINYQPKDFIFSLEDDRLKIYSQNSRKLVREAVLNVSEDKHNRKAYVDRDRQAVYAADDSYLKKYDFEGNVTASFKHISNRGYDVDGFSDKNYLYFTDGVGIVKFSKENLKPLAWAFTQNLGKSNGWAMGLKALSDSQGDKLVIFNNSAILVLDDKLKLVSFLEAGDGERIIKENLFLTVDKNKAPANTMFTLSGGGYAPGEELAISMAGQIYYAKTDSNGRFVKVLTVPPVLPGKIDINVLGKSSNLSYSLSFEIM